MQLDDAVIGVLVGGVFTAAGFIYKRRIENIATLKRSLFQLLILYRSVAVKGIDRKQMLNPLTEALYEIFPDYKKDQMHEEQANEVVSHLLGKTIKQEGDDLSSTYLKVVGDISEIDPVLAYRLNSNVDLKRYLAAVDEMTLGAMKSASESLSKSEMKFVEVFFEGITGFVTADVLAELKRDVMRLSLKCGVLTYIGVVLMIYRSKNVKSGDSVKYKMAFKKIVADAISESDKEI